MRRNDSYDRNMGELTDAYVHSAIRYLDPDDEVTRESEKSSSSELSVSIVSALLAFIGLICFYLWFR